MEKDRKIEVVLKDGYYGVIDNGMEATPFIYLNKKDAIAEWVYFERLNTNSKPHRRFLPRVTPNEFINEIESKNTLNMKHEFSSKDEAANIDNVPLAAFSYLYLMAGISEPTDNDNNWATEAIVYADPNYWVDKPMTHKEYANRRMFEIKALSYFMRKRNYNDMEAIKYFQEYEH